MRVFQDFIMAVILLVLLSFEVAIAVGTISSVYLARVGMGLGLICWCALTFEGWRRRKAGWGTKLWTVLVVTFMAGLTLVGAFLSSLEDFSRWLNVVLFSFFLFAAISELRMSFTANMNALQKN